MRKIYAARLCGACRCNDHKLPRTGGKKIAEEYSDGKLTPELVKLLKHKEMAAL